MRLTWLLALSLSVCAQNPLNDPENPVAGDVAAIETGRKTFVNSCAACHGANGEGGRGPALKEGRVIRRSSDFQMFTTIRKGVAGTDMPGSNLPDDQLWQLVAFVRSLASPAAETPVSGDSVKGERVYAANGCSACHMISGRGGSLGPDLSNAGGMRSYDYLRESVVKPAERVSQGYAKVVVKMRDGRSLEGTARNYSNYDLQLQSRDGKLYLLNSSDIADATVSVQTYMPLDYGKKIARDDLINLLAFLSKQSARPVELKKNSDLQRRGR
ncbi:MAG: c-type cytochrome [Candidatus Solibacter usitatus]|nr:c-type cytochrome [Candidatus Solibacter usitatus]